uniref:Cyclic nucleotide-binding domain-containing protein n=1 Tax=Phaeomonas parva TaxID=124430 RepID=A0A7S1XVK1_9STRA|mmetsp:Transcript_41184/g.129067  ORF Transcript_41184/g.129067 Transcript_41184/m.129067 type:complete len:1060 (+) Transcript_41184:299-3478(+)|eukprot:CAMPEP_0118859752 /NCGR_PEP_ID=MMETSP1163-20130328/5863_1 /TAXON_ID=124430 /ORGANISM="Phaeomonas parva, Strain CCMP2877" /LENGTH=1059 /DNA_ID=CAMNT_0006793379 /DNA_START=266 /DNA_END=3445 /DNA_ORIENTATION=-
MDVYAVRDALAVHYHTHTGGRKSYRNVWFHHKNIEEHFLFDPASDYYLCYVNVMKVLDLYAVIATPLVVALCLMGDPEETWTLIFDHIVTAAIFIDMAVTCNTVTVEWKAEAEPNLICTRKEIVRNYISGGLALSDFIAASCFLVILPFEDQIWGLAVIRLLRLLRLNRIFTAIRAALRVGSKLEVRIMNNTLGKFIIKVRIYVCIVVVLILLHFLTCGLMSVGGIGMHYNEPNWLDLVHDDGDSRFDVYVTAFYWATMTLTSIGYGDIVMVTTMERLYAIFTMLLGATGYAFFLSVVSDELRVQLLNQREEDEVQKDIAGIEEFISHLKGIEVHEEVLRAVKQVLVHRRRATGASRLYGKDGLLSASPGLRRHISMYFSEHVLKRVAFLNARGSDLFCDSGSFLDGESIMQSDSFAAFRISNMSPRLSPMGLPSPAGSASDIHQRRGHERHSRKHHRGGRLSRLFKDDPRHRLKGLGSTKHGHGEPTPKSTRAAPGQPPQVQYTRVATGGAAGDPLESSPRRGGAAGLPLESSRAAQAEAAERSLEQEDDDVSSNDANEAKDQFGGGDVELQEAKMDATRASAAGGTSRRRPSYERRGYFKERWSAGEPEADRARDTLDSTRGSELLTRRSTLGRMMDAVTETWIPKGLRRSDTTDSFGVGMDDPAILKVVGAGGFAETETCFRQFRILLADSMSVQVFAQGEKIVRESDKNDCFYIVKSGHVLVTQHRFSTVEENLIRTSRRVLAAPHRADKDDGASDHHYFGEEILLHPTAHLPALYSAKARTVVDTYTITRKDFWHSLDKMRLVGVNDSVEELIMHVQAVMRFRRMVHVFWIFSKVRRRRNLLWTEEMCWKAIGQYHRAHKHHHHRSSAHGGHRRRGSGAAFHVPSGQGAENGSPLTGHQQSVFAYNITGVGGAPLPPAPVDLGHQTSAGSSNSAASGGGGSEAGKAALGLDPKFLSMPGGAADSAPAAPPTPDKRIDQIQLAIEAMHANMQEMHSAVGEMHKRIHSMREVSFGARYSQDGVSPVNRFSNLSLDSALSGSTPTGRRSSSSDNIIG